MFTYLLEKTAGIKVKYVPFSSGLGIFFLRPIAAVLTSLAIVAVAIPAARAAWHVVARARRSAWAS